MFNPATSSSVQLLLLSRRLAPGPAGDGLFLDARGAALQATQVVELGPADSAPAGDLKGLNQRGVEGEDSLHADAAAGRCGAR